MKKCLLIALLGVFAGVFASGLTACGDSAGSQAAELKEMNMKLRLTSGDRTWSVTLYDNVAARDLVTQLPLKLTWRDFNRTEKIADLPEKLSTAGAPPGFAPVIGDLAYYAPWGNLAIFYRDYGYSDQLVRLGKIADVEIGVLRNPGELEIKIEAGQEKQP